MVNDKERLGDKVEFPSSTLALEMMDPVMVPRPKDSLSLSEALAAFMAEVKVAVEATEYEPYIEEAVELICNGRCLRPMTGVCDKSKVNSIVLPGNSFLK